MALIEATNLSKTFRTRQRHNSFWQTAKSFLIPQYREVPALKEANFSIGKGELVGYIGPNGAGKSTTIKILSGILTPSHGKVLVRGIEPYRNRRENALKMGVVFGQRGQLYWDLPLSDSLDLFKVMYKIPASAFEERFAVLKDLLGLDAFMDRPVRQLSLGQKMRANLCAAFIHNPDIVYLDEPTIGLDVMAKEAIRTFIRHINEKYGTTVILTTHDMDDIEEICQRLILIDKGKIFYDGPLDQFIQHYGAGSEIVLDLSSRLDKLEDEDAHDSATLHGNIITVKVPQKEAVPETVERYLKKYPVKDISVKGASLEEIIKRVFKEGSAGGQ